MFSKGRGNVHPTSLFWGSPSPLSRVWRNWNSDLLSNVHLIATATWPHSDCNLATPTWLNAWLAESERTTSKKSGLFWNKEAAQQKIILSFGIPEIISPRAFLLQLLDRTPCTMKPSVRGQSQGYNALAISIFFLMLGLPPFPKRCNYINHINHSPSNGPPRIKTQGRWNCAQERIQTSKCSNWSTWWPAYGSNSKNTKCNWFISSLSFYLQEIDEHHQQKIILLSIPFLLGKKI